MDDTTESAQTEPQEEPIPEAEPVPFETVYDASRGGHYPEGWK